MSSRDRAIKWINGAQDYFYWWVLLFQTFVQRHVLQACLITRLKNTFLMVRGPEVLRIVTDWICSGYVWGMFEHFKLDEKRLETDIKSRLIKKSVELITGDLRHLAVQRLILMTRKVFSHRIPCEKDHICLSWKCVYNLTLNNRMFRMCNILDIYLSRRLLQTEPNCIKLCCHFKIVHMVPLLESFFLIRHSVSALSVEAKNSKQRKQ